MAVLPDNFERLHAGEELVRQESVATLQKAADAKLHLEVNEKAADTIHYFIHRDEPDSEDDLTVRLLGIRMFNGLNASLKLLLSGYYQASTLQQRDIVETLFLLDHLSMDRSLIARWRTADEKQRKSEFSPAAVRKALDARDGFKEKRRETSYKRFSQLAGHPHPVGFAMVRLPNGLHHCGPYFDEKPLLALLSELGRTAAQAGKNFDKFFTPTTKSDLTAQLAFMDVQQRWYREFYGADPFDQAALDAMRDEIASLPD